MPKKSQATWGGRFESGPSDLMQRFSESVSFDNRLAGYDIACSLAHAAMLKKVGLLEDEAYEKITHGLKALEEEIASGNFKWDPALEDVHMNIEQALVRRVPEATRLHTGRSRNDQVATDMRLYFKDAIAGLCGRLTGLLKSFQEMALRALEERIVIPGYTHLQRAQPVPLAHHLHACLEMFYRDFNRFKNLEDEVNHCPLGSGALGGSTLPLDREYVADLLGFTDADNHPQVTRNSMDAVADRDLFLGFADAAVTCALHLSRVAEDFILWNSAEFNFVELPDAYTTGSSLMPQKKNPDALELIRGKAGRILGNQHMIQVMVKGLPMTYNRDFQEDKPPVFDIEQQLGDCLLVLGEMLPGVGFRKAVTDRAVEDPMLLATDLVDFLVEKGIPFREAHHGVGHLVHIAENLEIPITSLDSSHLRGLEIKLPEDWKGVFSLERALAKRSGTGMPGWEPVTHENKRWSQLLSNL